MLLVAACNAENKQSLTRKEQQHLSLAEATDKRKTRGYGNVALTKSNEERIYHEYTGIRLDAE